MKNEDKLVKCRYCGFKGKLEYYKTFRSDFAQFYRIRCTKCSKVYTTYTHNNPFNEHD